MEEVEVKKIYHYI